MLSVLVRKGCGLIETVLGRSSAMDVVKGMSESKREERLSSASSGLWLGEGEWGWGQARGRTSWGQQVTPPIRGGLVTYCSDV